MGVILCMYVCMCVRACVLVLFFIVCVSFGSYYGITIVVGVILCLSVCILPCHHWKLMNENFKEKRKVNKSKQTAKATNKKFKYNKIFFLIYYSCTIYRSNKDMINLSKLNTFRLCVPNTCLNAISKTARSLSQTYLFLKSKLSL